MPALVTALRAELPRVEKAELSDAALALLEALAKQKSAIADEAIRTALGSSDYLIRKRAIALLKENGAGDFSNRLGALKIRNTPAIISARWRESVEQVRATITTSKGSFVILLLPTKPL